MAPAAGGLTLDETSALDWTSPGSRSRYAPLARLRVFSCQKVEGQGWGSEASAQRMGRGEQGRSAAPTTESRFRKSQI